MADFIIGDYAYTIVGNAVEIKVVDTTKSSYEPLSATVVYNNVTYTVTSMKYCFNGCTNFNQSITIPNSITNLLGCFNGCTSFNQPITIPNSVTNMDSCFSGCTSFNQPITIPKSVTDMAGCFSGCTNFNQPITIPKSITDMSYCFGYCTNFNQPITIPNSVTDMSFCFGYCANFNQSIKIPNSVTNMSYCFYGCHDLTTVSEIPSSVTNMDGCFYGCSSLMGNIIVNNNPESYDSIFLNTVRSIGLKVTNQSALSTWQTIADSYSNVIIGKVKDKIASKIYYPLDRNLENKGTQGTTIAFLGTLSYTVGVTDYAFNGDGSTYLKVSGCNLGSTATVMCWARTSTVNKMLWVLETDNSSSLLNLWNYSSGFYLNTGDSTNNPFKNDNNQIVPSITDNEWHHYTVTFDNSETKLYIDGEYKGKATTFKNPTSTNKAIKIAGGYNNTHNYDWTGGIDEFKIFDECLTEAEIKKELGIGELILHLPLSNNGKGYKNPNILMNTYTMSINSDYVKGFRISGTGTLTQHYYDDLPVGSGAIRVTNSTSASASCGLCQDGISGPTIGKTYTQSCWVRASADNVITDLYLLPLWRTSDAQSTGSTQYIQTFTLTTEWQYIEINGLMLRGNQADYYSAGYAYATVPAGGWFEICGMKVEEGYKATEWQPSLLDYLNPYIKYDKYVYVEPDGSQWLRISHHNNPASYKFDSNDDFSNGVYKNSNCWYNVEDILRQFSSCYEFMVKQKGTSSDTEVRYRWVQYTNPLCALWDEVNASQVTRITDGYTNGTYGGLYRGSSNTRMRIADGVAGDWFGAIGCWANYTGGSPSGNGIPGYPGTKITTGYLDLYIRIDTALETYKEYDISSYHNDAQRRFTNNNLLLGSAFNADDAKVYNASSSSSLDWSQYLRKYNAATATFSGDTATVTLNSASNLGICFVRKASDIHLDSNSYYTLLCEVKSTQTANPLCIGLSYYTTSNSWVWRGGSNPHTFSAANTWYTFATSFKPDADTQYICYCFTVVGTANGTNTFSIRHCRLVKGTAGADMDKKPYTWSLSTIPNWLQKDTPKYRCSNHTEQVISNYLQAKSMPIVGTNATLAAWIKREVANTYDDGQENIIRPLTTYLNVTSEGKLAAYAYGKSPAGYHQSNATIPMNEWTHVAAVWNETSLKLYINGELDNTIACTGTISRTTGTPYVLIGNMVYMRQFYGGISDVRVYNKALTAHEILSLYNNNALVDNDGTIHGQIRG